MAKIRPAADTTHTYVDTDEAMGELLAWLDSAEKVAIDLEADSLYHYHEKVCLVQLTAGGRNFLVDPLAAVDLRPFLAALADKTLILHGTDYDLRMLRGSFGFAPNKPVIDTMAAGQLIGCKKFGLSSLILEYAGATLSKAGQKSDWSRRPLTAKQLRYAVDDTRFLEPLAERLLGELDGLGRREWFDQWCQAAMAATEANRPTDPQRQWRIKGVRDLTARQAAFVRELWRWREREAKRADLPPFKIITNEALLELAVWAERHERADLTSGGRGPKLPRHFRRRRLKSLQAAIDKVRQLHRKHWPAPRLPSLRKRTEPKKGFHRLRIRVAHLAEELGLDPAVIAPRAAMEDICRRRLTDADAIAQAGKLLPWQVELLTPIVRAVFGED